jgi:hypothetical protein
MISLIRRRAELASKVPNQTPLSVVASSPDRKLHTFEPEI